MTEPLFRPIREGEDVTDYAWAMLCALAREADDYKALARELAEHWPEYEQFVERSEALAERMNARHGELVADAAEIEVERKALELELGIPIDDDDGSEPKDGDA